MKTLIYPALFVLLFSICTAQGQSDKMHLRDKPADATELVQITERGREIATYDRAAWIATDAVQALKPAPGAINAYVARRTSFGWELAFGTLNADRTAFLIAYVVRSLPDGTKPKVLAQIPVVRDTQDWLVLARAIEISREQLKVTRPYNDAVLRDKNG